MFSSQYTILSISTPPPTLLVNVFSKKVAVVFVLPLPHVRYESKMKRPIDQLSNFALVLGTQPQPHIFHDLPTQSHIASTQIDIVLVQQILQTLVCFATVHTVRRCQVAWKNDLKVSESVGIGRTNPGQVAARIEAVA